MLIAYLLSAFQWSVVTFLFGIIVGVVRISIWVTTKISIIESDINENNKRDEETKRTVEDIRKEERSNYKELTKSLSDIIQGLVRVEEKVSHIEKQIDKK